VLHLVALSLLAGDAGLAGAATAADDATVIDGVGAIAPSLDDDASDDTGPPARERDETIIRTRRLTSPRAVEVPVRREGLAIGGASAAALLSLVPGVFVSQHAGQGKAPQLFLRGFDVEHGQDIEVRVEGVPLNEAGNIHGQGYADTTFIPIELVRHLTLHEGVADARQGDFAVAGSIDHSLGLASPGVVASGTLGSFGLRRIFVGGRPAGASPHTFVGGEFIASDDFGPARAFSRVNLLGGIEQPVLPGIEAFAFAATSTSEAQSAGVVRLDDRAIADLDDDALFAAAVPGQGLRAQRHLASLRLRRKGALSTTTLQTSASLRRLQLRHNFTGRLLFDEGDTVLQTTDSTMVMARAEHEERLMLFDRVQQLRVGTEARGDVVDAIQRRLRDDGTVHRDEVDARFDLGHLGLWADTTVRPSSWSRIHLGARLEGVAFRTADHTEANRVRTTTGAVFAPRVGLEIDIVDDVDINASYGEGFRTPPPLALADGETPPLTVVRTSEVGVVVERAAPGASLTARASGFVTHVAADRVFDHATASSLFVGPSLRTGAQAFVDVVVDGAGVTASATATRAAFPDGGVVPFAPPLVLRLDGFVETPPFAVGLLDVVGRAELGTGLVSARPLPFGDTADPVVLVDGAVSIRAGGVRVGLEGANLTDARVADGVFVYASRFEGDDSRVPARHITAASPRLLQLTLTLTL
jgi:iron complex outermembrane receptor protein